MHTNTNSLAILVAGPYRSGTNDDPALIQANMEHMNRVAMEVYRLGHLPLLGEWLALPLIKLAGSQKIGDDVFNEIFHPSSVRLLHHCDAVLRTGGASTGADEMVNVGRELGKKIFSSVGDIPAVSQ